MSQGKEKHPFCKFSKKRKKKAWQQLHKKFWASPGGNTPQSSSCTSTYLPSRKLSKLDEPDMQVTAGEAGTISYGPPVMAEKKQGDQLKPTYRSSVRIRDVALRTCQKRWTIGRRCERESQGYLCWRHNKMMMNIGKYILKLIDRYFNKDNLFNNIFNWYTIKLVTHTRIIYFK